MVMATIRIRDNVELGGSDYRVTKIPAATSSPLRPRPAQAASSPWTRASAPAASTATRPKSPPSASDAWWIRDPSQKTRAETMNYTVVDPTSVLATHITELVRRHADELLTRDEGQQPARAAQGVQRRRRRRGRAGRALATARSSACCRRCLRESGLDPRPRRRCSRRSATRPASPATRRCSPSTPARPWAARSPRRSSTHEGNAARDRARPRASSRRWPRRSCRPPTASSWPWTRSLAAVPSSSRRPSRSSSRSPQGGRPVLLCSARVRRHLRHAVRAAPPAAGGLLVQRDQLRESGWRPRE